MILRMHIRTFGDKQFDDFLVATWISRRMQRSPSKLTLRIHIRTISNSLFDGFDFSLLDSLK